VKALICKKPNSLTLEDVATLPVPVGWVPLDVVRVGICGTDYHIYHGKQPFLSYPRIMGHEVSGYVRNDYSGDAFAKGDLVIANPYLACGTCHACAIAKPNCCEHISVIGVHRDGAMTQHFALPERNLIAAKGLTPDQAAMVEFLAIGRHAVARTRVTKEAKTLIVGAGPIGLATALFARIDGCEVTIADISAEKLAMSADRFGFATIDLSQHAAQDLALSYTHVFDATGSVQAMNAGLNYVAHGGTYTLVSVVKDNISFADPEFHKRETTLISSRNAMNEDFVFVINTIRDGLIDTDKIKTHGTTLAGAVVNLPKWALDRNSVIKAIIEIA
jgi:2-desacetyl-2-hydroxyethyl bacteriochlorophyllide A dehydrogenase